MVMETTEENNQENDNIEQKQSIHEKVISEQSEIADADFQLELEDAQNQQEIVEEEIDWKEVTGLSFDGLCGAIETVVFMSDKPVKIQRIRNIIHPDVPLRAIHEAIQKLQEDYEKAHHGIRLQEVAEGYQFRTKATYSKYVQDLYKVSSVVLSPTALEVLAIVAYKQPISRVELEKIRGVESAHILRGLMDKRLLKILGRSDEAGKPATYGTTEEFLEVFNLSNIDQLPTERELTELAETKSAGEISDIKTLAGSGQQEFMYDEIEELDQLSKGIKEIAADTDFTKLLKVEDRKRKSKEENTPIKSAFDLLEEYLAKAEIAEQNKLAAQSIVPKSILHLEEVQEMESNLVDDDQDIDLEEIEQALESSDDNFETVELNDDDDLTMSTDSDDEWEDDEEVSFEADDITEEEEWMDDQDDNDNLETSSSEDDNDEDEWIDEEENLFFDDDTKLNEALDKAFESLQKSSSKEIESIENTIDKKIDEFKTGAESHDLDLDFMGERTSDD